MKRRLLIGFILIVLGVLVFWLTRPELGDSDLKNTQKNNLKNNIAEIESLVGQATLKNSQDEMSTATAQSKIFENDSVATDQNSKLIFHLASGAKFEMAPLTKVIFEMNARNVSMTVLEGQIQLLSEEKGAFEVSKKGKSLSLEELKTPIESPSQATPLETSQIQATVEEIPPVAKKESGPKKMAHTSSSLDQEEINKVMRNQTSFLHRCYINYMLRSQRLDLKGQVVLSFIIQPSGKVLNTKVISSPIQDEQLDRCLTDVISRATFKEFTSAQPILVQAYPIHLD